MSDRKRRVQIRNQSHIHSAQKPILNFGHKETIGTYGCTRLIIKRWKQYSWRDHFSVCCCSILIEITKWFDLQITWHILLSKQTDGMRRFWKRRKNTIFSNNQLNVIILFWLVVICVCIIRWDFLFLSSSSWFFLPWIVYGPFFENIVNQQY